MIKMDKTKKQDIAKILAKAVLKERQKGRSLSEKEIDKIMKEKYSEILRTALKKTKRLSSEERKKHELELKKKKKKHTRRRMPVH